jgi:hypothetical protein
MRASLFLLSLLIAQPLSAVTLTASTVRGVDPGSIATVCVSLGTGGTEVAGTQNDLVWDGSCLTLPDSSACYASGSHSKQLQGKLLDNRDFAYRALILSLSDVDPIDDGVLYCCDFIVEAASGACCTVDLTGLGAADPQGNALGVAAAAGEVCVGPEPEISLTPLIVATPTTTATLPGEPTAVPVTASPTPTHTPIACSQCTPSPTDDDGGCQVTAPTRLGTTIWPLAVAAIIALLRRRSLF